LAAIVARDLASEYLESVSELSSQNATSTNEELMVELWLEFEHESLARFS
jgi:hypothetical protein